MKSLLPAIQRPKRFIAVAIVIFAIAIWVRSCLVPIEMRCRLTLDILVDGAPFKASNVSEIYLGGGFDTGRRWVLVGEALTADFGPRGVLAVTLLGPDGRHDYWVDFYETLANLTKTSWDEPDEVARNVDALPEGTGVELPLDKLPFLVRFPNRNDEWNRQKADPRNLESVFGPGVKLADARIEKTNARITTGIVKVLPWLAKQPGLTQYIDPKKNVDELDYNDFRTVWSQ